MSAGYAELHCLSNFSFQRGASSARDLFERAKHHGYQALAITDECTLAGIVRAWQAAKEVGLPLITGSEMRVEGGPKLVLLAEDLAGYQALCRIITAARMRAPKGEYRLLREDLEAGVEGLLALWVPDAASEGTRSPAHPATAGRMAKTGPAAGVARQTGEAAAERGPAAPEAEAAETDAEARWLRALFPGRLWIAVELHREADDAAKLARLQALGQRLGLPLVAAGDVHMHARGRRALQDVMTAIRHHVTVAEAGWRLFPNGERHLRPLRALSGLYPPQLLEESVRIARRCRFDLGELRYQYPHELVPAGHTATSWLRQLTEEGLSWRWPEGVPTKARALAEKELALIAELGYESYFLTVHDIVLFARGRDILCQGRGSAANSVVCYALGITAIDPDRIGMLFERFISRERNEPPDIDVDFEHERREEVIQYVFERYGRHRAALTAIASSYRGAGAVRDVARVLGLPPDQIDVLSGCVGRWSETMPAPERLCEAGFDPDSPLLRRILVLAGELIGFPRHLSQHPGGFVISEQPLHALVPVENASMQGRTVVQWDKDDLDALGLLKVDVLALGMLTALRKTFDLVRRHQGRELTLANIPASDDATWDMIGRADTIGVFQIESRAQMAMLPRLRPREFYDLVIQVAIVRPGPIQGDMVHPYLRRRNGEEPVTWPSEALKKVFKRTLGVPLFQEQVMELAIVAADYTPGEADGLRRSMAAWKRHGGLEHHRELLISRMLKNGYSGEFAERIFEQIKGFGSYGFPESHAASFALLTWASCWLKQNHPVAFACALVNSQPMGFYSPDQILQDLRRHGGEVRPVDVRWSGWDCSMEAVGGRHGFALRMGLRMVRGFREEDALRIERTRAARAFTSVEDLCERAVLDARARTLLADSGALRGLAGHRHRARWAVAGVEERRPLLGAAAQPRERQVALPLPSVGQDLEADYATVGTTLGRHPMALLRAQLQARRCRSSRELPDIASGRSITAAGLVVGRQRPQTASGVTFITLEDEHGMINVVVWRQLAERQRRPFLEARLLMVEGKLETEGDVRHLIAKRLHDLTPLLGNLDTRSRDFH